MTSTEPLDNGLLMTLSFYRTYCGVHRRSPSFSEAARALNVTSQAVGLRVKRLVALGYLKKQRGRSTSRAGYVLTGKERP